MRQERFTEQAQEALAASQKLVGEYHHSQWDVEHILLALLQQQAGLVGDLLKELGVDLEAVRRAVVSSGRSFWTRPRSMPGIPLCRACTTKGAGLPGWMNEITSRGMGRGVTSIGE